MDSGDELGRSRSCGIPNSRKICFQGEETEKRAELEEIERRGRIRRRRLARREWCERSRKRSCGGLMTDSKKSALIRSRGIV